MGAVARQVPITAPEEAVPLLEAPWITAEALEPTRVSMTRAAAKICGVARVLARHLDEVPTPARAQLLAEMDHAATALGHALVREERGRDVSPDDLDEILQLRASCL